jgi:hypothetical protein
MKKAPLCIAFIAIYFCAFTPPVIAGSGHLETSNHDTTAIRDQSIHDMLLDIMKVTGLQPIFEFKEAKVKNIEACISHKKRYILYNPVFIDQISKSTKDRWGVMALLAHEVGHHLNGHTIRKRDSNPEKELEADEFAGFVLYKLGASLEQAQEVMRYIARPQASSTHPARNTRMDAIQKGWNKAAATEGITYSQMSSDKNSGS